ncbi:MAG: hypothetical protein ACJ0BH_08190 [Candidatus Puniceispirillaceae bacterium]
MQKQPDLNILFEPGIMSLTVPQFSLQGQVTRMANTTQMTMVNDGILPQLTFGALTA